MHEVVEEMHFAFINAKARLGWPPLIPTCVDILVSPQIYPTITESFWLPLHLSHFPLSRHAYGLGLTSCFFCLTLGSQDGVLDALDAWKRHLDQIMMSQIG